MFSTVYSGALRGVEAVSVQVEAKSGMLGDFAMIVVGLPDAAVKESGDRVTAAFSSCRLALPFSKTVINLAPGDIRKEGPMYDLPIALSLLVANGTLPPDRLSGFVVAGELGLDGAVRPVRGGVSLALLARKEKRDVILPKISAEEAALVEGVNVYPVENLLECLDFLTGKKTIKPLSPEASSFNKRVPAEALIDFSEVKGQYQLRRAVEIAVAGGHNILMIGSPGSGKSMIAKRIPTILPEPDLDEFLEILGIQSAAGITISSGEHCIQRPFRAPHHTISDVGLIGGGSAPGPGEISLAHNGVLFLDEFPEFKRSVLEVLRQPLEDGEVTISRASAKITLPAHFMLVAAMNPCPCGYYGDRHHHCHCSPSQIQRYRSRVSGPLLDRIDIHVNAPTLSIEELQNAKPGESSAVVRSRIVAARAVQNARFLNDVSMGPKTRCNARMTNRQIQKYCTLGAAQSRMLQIAMERFGLSARAYSRILKVSRTIADLAGHDEISAADVSEAINFRLLDKANEVL